MNPTQQQVLNESNQAAQRAARLIGGSFQQGRLNSQGQLTGGFTPSSPNTIVSAEQLGGIQPYPYALPDETIPTASSGLGSYLESLQLDPTSQQAMTTANSLIPQTGLEDQKNTWGQKLLDSILGRKGETELQDEEYSETVDPAKKELDEIQNQIRSKSLAYRRQVEEIQKNAGGATAAGVQGEVGRIEREANSELADLSIIEQAKLQNYSTAKEIADRKIAMVLEQEATEIEGLKFAYSEIKEDFNKEEDRRFNLMISERERLLNQEEDRMKTIQSLAIEAVKAGTPTSVVSAMQKAGSVEEALRIGGQYLAPRGGNRSTQVIEVNGKKLLIDTQTGELITEFGADIGGVSPYQEERQTRILSSVEELKGRATGRTVGVLSLGRFAPGSVQRDFASDLNTLKASIAFGELTAMREASKTGGALGQVSNIELGLLESALGALDQGQSPANFRKNLDKIKASIERWQSAVSKETGKTKVWEGVTYELINGVWTPQ